MEYMADAMERMPNFDGYIFLQDDVILNFWNFPIRHDFTKVWRAFMWADPHPLVYHYHMNITLGPAGAARFPNPLGPDNSCPMDRVVNFVNGFSPEEKDRLFHENSVDDLPSFKMAFSDFYYIPSRYRAIILPHFKRSRELSIFHEIGLPIIFDAVVPSEDTEEIIGGALSTVTDTVKKIALYDPCWDYYHKLKASKPQEFEFLVEAIFRYGPMTGKWDCLDSGSEGLTSYRRIED